MAEIEMIDADFSLPPNGSHVEILQMKNGLFRARGLVSGSVPSPTLAFLPAPFETLNEAIASSRAWADVHRVEVVYVRKA